MHLYIDGRHNREVIYNADDTHVFLLREEHKPYGPIKRHVRGRPDWFIEGRVTEIEGGYVMEIRIWRNSEGGQLAIIGILAILLPSFENANFRDAGSEHVDLLPQGVLRMQKANDD